MLLFLLITIGSVKYARAANKRAPVPHSSAVTTIGDSCGSNRVTETNKKNTANIEIIIDNNNNNARDKIDNKIYDVIDNSNNNNKDVAAIVARKQPQESIAEDAVQEVS